MRILLSNDDGISAPGIEVAHALLSSLKHEVCVIAPQHQSSGISHSFTISTPLFLQKFVKNSQFSGYAIHGTPADSVKLGLNSVYSNIDAVITGINLGNNAGPAVYDSGSIGAAFEGIGCGKPSMAFSFDSFHEKDFEGLEERLLPFMEKILSFLDKKILWNVNIPNTPKIQGIQITRQFLGFFTDTYEQRVSPREKEYYWLTTINYTEETSSFLSFYANPCFSEYLHDMDALKQGFISMTPLQFDLTCYEKLKELTSKLSQ